MEFPADCGSRFTVTLSVPTHYVALTSTGRYIRPVACMREITRAGRPGLELFEEYMRDRIHLNPL